MAGASNAPSLSLHTTSLRESQRETSMQPLLLHQDLQATSQPLTLGGYPQIVWGHLELLLSASFLMSFRKCLAVWSSHSRTRNRSDFLIDSQRQLSSVLQRVEAYGRMARLALPKWISSCATSWIPSLLPFEPTEQEGLISGHQERSESKPHVSVQDGHSSHFQLLW